ncbi:MAG: phage major capsid protein [Candidatus Thorarchaeota archaeon]|nr:MAG: phage major capsid protein [Candidatus Thorarchaeota archaeon]
MAIPQYQRRLEESLIDKYDLLEQEIRLDRPLEELALFSPTMEELNASIRRDTQKLLIPEVINENILTVAEEARIARNLCQYVRIDTDSITWLKERGFDAVQVEEGSEIPSRQGTYEKYTLVVGKIAARPYITNEMIEDSRWDVIRRNLDMATLAMAVLEDRITINALIQGVPNGTTMSNGVGGIGEVIDNHYIQMGDDAPNATLSWKSIALGIALLRMENYSPDTLLIHPYQMVDLLTGEGDFIGANERAYMTLPEHIRNSMLNGVVGSIGGMNVLVSANMTPGKALMIDSKQYGVFVERRPLTIDNTPDPLRDSQSMILTERFTAAAINRDAGVLLYGGKSDLFP